MPTLDTLATRFARCVSLFRDPSAKSEQKKEFRALLGLLQDTAVTLRVDARESGIELNGVPCEGAGLAELVQRLDLHGIGEIALPAAPPPASASSPRDPPRHPQRLRRPGRRPPPKTSVDAIPSSPARIRRSIGSPASTARRASCVASRGAISSPCRSTAFPWSRTTRRHRRPRTRCRGS